MKFRLAGLLIAAALPASAATLKIDGEVYAQRSAPLLPPAVNRMWQFTITRLAADGGPVKQGDVVLAFDSSEVMKQLAEKNSLLQERQRELDKLQLELAERERTRHLETAHARAEFDKASRKTGQPQEYIAGIQYRKLVVARRQAESKLALAQRREIAAASQRTQERRLVVSQIAQLQADVDRLQASLGALNVVAPRSGIMMHKSSWRGDKFDVGTQVWMGQTIAEIPDNATLAVRAQLPERDLWRVRKGVPAQIRIEGGSGSDYRGKVVSIGRSVRSKSQIQPIPVLDVEIELEDPRARLKPGQAVRVELTVPDRTGPAS